MSMSSAGQTLQQRVAVAILDGAARTLAIQGPAASMDDVALAALREIDERIRSARIAEVPTDEAIARVVRTLVDVGDLFTVLARERPRPAEFESTLAAPLAQLFERAQAGG